MNSVALIVFAAGVVAFVARRLLRYLQFFQQEEYNRKRFKKWIQDNRAYDKKGTAILVVCSLLGWYSFAPSATVHAGFALLTAALLTCIAYKLEEDPRRSGKIKLNMTERATRIYQLALTPPDDGVV